MRKIGGIIAALIITDHANGIGDLQSRYRQHAHQEQTDLGNRQVRCSFFEKYAHADEEEMSDKGEEHVVMPIQPAAQFVVVEADFDLGGPEDDLDRSAHAAETNQFARVHVGRGVGEVVFDLSWVL